MNELFVSCTPGLEQVLGEELRELGLQHVRSVPGGADATGSYEFVNRHSRIASRVLARIGSVKKVEQLHTVKLPAKLPVRVEGGDRAWQQAAYAAWGEGDGLELSLRMHHGEVQVSVDTSGELLHMRGYRQEIGRAPMRETLAAGMLRLAKYDPALPLWDVMCGSGTLIIEAAEFAAGLAPGRNRKFAFDQWAVRAEPVEAAAGRLDTFGVNGSSVRNSGQPSGSGSEVIIGTDLNAGALGTARRNAKRAGVFEKLTLERLDATKLVERDLSVGLVVANLPYGKRVGEKSELGSLYRALGLSLRKACPGWRFALLLEEGAELLGLPIQETTEVVNGGLRCEVVTGKVPW